MLKIETVNLSEAELATLAERKATTAMAKGQLRDAQDNYYQVLAHDPRNQGRASSWRACCTARGG